MAIECLIIEDDKFVADSIQVVGNDFDQTSFSHVREEQETALNIIFQCNYCNNSKQFYF
jgi:hypothetical protein|tara:strand:+ start:413 stop:589 length:177 start_codon:yes stop_codon:yes gene_type:complete